MKELPSKVQFLVAGLVDSHTSWAALVALKAPASRTASKGTRPTSAMSEHYYSMNHIQDFRHPEHYSSITILF